MLYDQLDPNPTRGEVPATDWLRALLIILCYIPGVLARVCSRHISGHSVVPFKEDFKRAVLREGLCDIPRSVVRNFMTPKSLKQSLSRQRFHRVHHELCEEVREQDFAAFWVCRGLRQSLPPNKCSIVVLYSHGGGYTAGHPLFEALQWLRIAEIAQQNDVTIAVFSMNYTLAPEAQFPRQREQAACAYRYLIERMGVDPGRIVISGQSAGGHLALSLLRAISNQEMPRPAGALLICPWIDLTNSSRSVVRNAKLDSLDKTSLDNSVKLFLGQKNNMEDFTDCDYAKSLPPDEAWGSILPRYTWISVGTHDIFIDSIVKFAQNAQGQGAVVKLVTVEDQPHGWEIMNDVADFDAYCRLDSQSDVGTLMRGSAHLAKGLLEMHAALQ